MAASTPFRTNPSTIARYFFHDCERFLYYSSADPKLRQREGIPEPEFDHSPLIAAVLESGYRWEQEVVGRLLAGRVVIAPGTGELHTRRLPPQETVRCLKCEPAGRFLYQATLSPPSIFYKTYHIDRDLVVISDNHPDLVAILPDEQGGRLLRIVDVKRGDALKLTHRVQVLLYALELQALIEAEAVADTRVDLDRGAVWLGKQDEPETFDLSAFRPHLEQFLRNDLGRILAGTADEARWHLYHRCEWCEFFEHCREEMRRTDDLSRLGQLTTYGKRHLNEEAGVWTLTELGKFLKRADADEVLDRCASLAGQRHHLQTRVQAMETEAPKLYGSSSPNLPRGENIALFLTLQREPLGQAVYLAGVLVTAREDIRREVFSPSMTARISNAEGKAEPCVWVADSPEDVPAVRGQLVEMLFEILGRVHRFNEKKKDWKEQLSLQAYVHTEEERALLFASLLEALQEPALAEKAMTLLFHFQGPELLQADQHPSDEVAYPVVVLLDAVSRLLALPVEVSYTLPEMLQALGSSFLYRRRDYYHFPLGHGMRAEALHAAWYKDEKANLDEIGKQARSYLFALQALLRAVRESASEHLVAWPPKFQLPRGAGINDRLLSRLAFFARYESLVHCLAIREARAEARVTQVLMGEVIELKARDASLMEVVSDLVLEPEEGGFPSWLLVRDSEEGRRAQVAYADYWYRKQPHGGSQSDHHAVVGVDKVNPGKDGPATLLLKYASNFKDEMPEKGERFLLYQRFTDFTTDRIVKFLEQMDRQRDGFFLQLLRDPEGAASDLSLPPKVAKEADRIAGNLDFTPSQHDAFRAMIRQRATAIWGPPGTGKTHFLASTILALAAAHARAGQAFRVLVTAYTHAAIQNLLRKVVQCFEELQRKPSFSKASGFRGEDLVIGKAKYWQGDNSPVEVVPEDALGDWLHDQPLAILGATVYSCMKQREELESFDLVVIDEASQVRVPEAAVAVSLVADNGRLVLAGDHLQLPPIIAGIYPDAPPGEPLLHRSIFEAMCPRNESLVSSASGESGMTASKMLRPLLENFRMNDVLTKIVARLLYGPRYCCASDEVARRRLSFEPGRGLDPLIRKCLDPAYPLVIVVLEGPRAARANPVEADLVAQMVVALRQGLRNPEGNRYKDDGDFFRRGVFIVSPHHAHIQAIRRELNKQRTWTAEPFVDTVDKMQGQEADAVIVSYGVSDPEFALREAEFIYGLNRLNVAITRARVKTVVCLPRPLLDATPQVLDIEPAALGLAFMRRLVAIAEEFGEEEIFEGEGAEARLLRVGKPLS